MNGLRIGLVGARGYVGAELIRLVAAHPRFELAYVTSRERAGQPLAAHVEGYSGGLQYTSPAYEDLPELGADAVRIASIAFRTRPEGSFEVFAPSISVNGGGKPTEPPTTPPTTPP